ncbi:transposon Ty3-G Gag-Pol polyprotein [Trichonephila inaurata madagascariensis]|uniref:Transposon Ty3-G Gag-Pol polyprotein n=1 Tax=Trichonephila inaurata madagascariensis TaxID=2747483 RepID=A0A8X6XWS0_9ARAC|nr:transposon Ty3-G Gag-Pol polyprotein [Trichonephila inaurata madagascariensis]
MEEFKISFNSAEVHEMLQKRKMKSKESPLEYFYSMKEISQQSSIDDQVLITYIIKGINDSTQNKTMLFGCTSIVEFKTKLRVYETYKREMKQSESFNRVTNVSNEVGKRSQIPCYNCQQQGHKSYECKVKIRNPKPKNFNYTKVLKAPTTHTVQDLPPNPRENLINFSSSEGSDLSLHINPENKVKEGIFESEMKNDKTKECSIVKGKKGNCSQVKKKEKVNTDEIDVVKNRTRKNNVLKISNISETDSDNGCTRCQIEVEDNSETKDFGENFELKETLECYEDVFAKDKYDVGTIRIELQRLPTSVQTILASITSIPVEKAVEVADRILEVSTPNVSLSTNAIASSSENRILQEIERLNKRIDDLTMRQRTPERRNNSRP